MHENRETSVAPDAVTGRSGKANGRTPDAHVAEGSDSGVVPMSQPNKSGQPQAEAGEGRLGIKENIAQPNMRPTQSGGSMPQGLSGVGQRAKD
jgi:RNA-directed DNA polymerase